MEDLKKLLIEPCINQVLNLDFSTNKNYINIIFKIFTIYSINSKNDNKLYNKFLSFLEFIKNNNIKLEPSNKIQIFKFLLNYNKLELAKAFIIEDCDQIYSALLEYYKKYNNKEEAISIFNKIKKPNEDDFYNIIFLFKNEQLLNELISKYIKLYETSSNYKLLELLGSKEVSIINNRCNICNNKIKFVKYQERKETLQAINNYILNIKTNRNNKVLSNDTIENIKYKWCTFKKILHKNYFNFIIDGANVGHQNSYTEININNINKVIEQLNGKILLILHQKHKKAISYFYNDHRVTLFITPYYHDDDWYSLYATLLYDTFLISNDKIRNHLNNFNTDYLAKWRQDHIITVCPSKMTIKKINYSNKAQKDLNYVHIPTIDNKWFHCELN